jgi:hypothetical protein
MKIHVTNNCDVCPISIVLNFHCGAIEMLRFANEMAWSAQN